MAVFLTLWMLLDTAIKGLLLQASQGLLPELMLGGIGVGIAPGLLDYS